MAHASEIADKVRLVGKKIHEADSEEEALVAGVSGFLPPLFSASSGKLIDVIGNASDHFACIVHSPRAGSNEGADEIPADNACAVIDLIEHMGIADLRAAHARALSAKRLEKQSFPALKDYSPATVILAVICARKVSEPIEVLTEEFLRLNETLSDHSDWIDMFAISDVATVSFGCQLAGQEGIGAILPPARSAKTNYSPAIYIVLTMQATGDGTFNKVLALIVSYTVFFQPGTRPINFNEILRGVCQSVVTVGGYQYNLAGDIAAVPPQHYIGRFVPPRPYLVEASGTKELLASLIYMPWQDGGVILLKGKLPLEALMIYLGADVLKKGGVIRSSRDAQASYVLPITPPDFHMMMERLGKQSNMLVRRVEPKVVMERMADEGTRTPFIARIFLGLLQLRDVAFQVPKERVEADKLISQALTPLLAARDAARGFREGWSTHAAEIESGKAVQVRGESISVNGDFYRSLRKEVNAFLYDAAKALKEGGQKVGKFCGQDIGFIFQKPGAYQTGLAALRLKNPVLADYAQATREQWSNELIDARNALDHVGWSLPRPRYEIENGKVSVYQPEVSGKPVVEFVDQMIDRVTCFTEDFFAYCFQQLLPQDVDLFVRPLSQRPDDAPERFRLTLRRGGMPLWQLQYSGSRFEER